MRIGASIILKGGKAVQSYGWKMLRPLGSLQGVLESLDEYECDEISITRYVRGKDCQRAFAEDLAILQNCRTNSPVSFGGGLRAKEDLELICDLPVERLVFSSNVINGDYEILEEACSRFGRQSVQCVLPLFREKDEIRVFDCLNNSFCDLKNIEFSVVNKLANEVIIYDVVHDGYDNTFDLELMKYVPLDPAKLVLTGGIGTETVSKAREYGCASVLIDNRVLHREYSVKGIKRNAGL